jgi:hypothetical protein
MTLFRRETISEADAFRRLHEKKIRQAAPSTFTGSLAIRLRAGDRGNDALLDEAYTQMHPLRHEETVASVEVPYGGVRHGDVAIRDTSLIHRTSHASRE